MKTTTILAAALALGCAFATPAVAQTESVRVSYADLDLGSPAGVEALNRRLSRAVTALCGTYARVGAGDWIGISRCRAAAKASIAPQLAQVMYKHAADGTRVASAR